MQGAGALTLPTSTPGLARADALFRTAGKLTLALLLVTTALLALDAEYWTTVFLASHVAALIALVPLGVALVVHAFRQARITGDPGILGVMRRYRAVVALLALIVVGVAITLANFDDESNRWVRRAANLTTVALVLVLVVQYLRWSRRQRGAPEIEVV
ncbi:MAG: hypothetical protein WD058_05620 [Dehalococcoidia bacterium]